MAPRETASDIAAKLKDVTPEPTEETLTESVQPQAAPAPVVEQAPAATQSEAPAPVPQAVPPAQSQQAQSQQAPPALGAQSADKPFYAVPYSVRSTVAPPPGNAQDERPRPPGPGDGDEVRFQAVQRDAEDVKLSELQGVSKAAQQPAAPAPAANRSVPEVGPVEAPPVPAPVPAAEVPQDVTMSEAVPSGQSAGVITGAVAPPPGVQATESATVPQQVQQVAPAAQKEPVDAPVETQAVTPPEATAPVPTPVPEVAEAAPEPEQPAAEVAEEAPAQATAAEEAEAEAEEEPVTIPEGVPEEELTTEQKLLLVKEKMYDAQSMMFNGNLEAADTEYKELLKKPYLPEDMREEILYAVADIAMQLHKNDEEGFFDPINDAYLAALNANLESKRVPHALLNLGLVNLKAGNIPEAKAYFNILRNKYPDDQNIPAISYYWGDYYFKQGDYKKAADQLQYMIQKYPEHELVKSAAYMLAQALERTGYDEQAFQVTDYIDKRWPDFYMQEPEFLLLAGEIEERVGKYSPAKDHYFTYYNLNPEADRADIALAKIGDLYLKLDQKQPAKEIYQKAAEDYPDDEGGLIAKMRLAEEGIYDDPTLVQMGGVFDRPYNLKPVNIYTDIVEKHPDSPLAPVAQLKLAMWYAFHDKYADALTASQDFLDKFPDSPLAKRARDLGDSVFVKALPGLIEEENYKRVVRYWEDYDFIGEEGTKVDDQSKLMVATAYWKLGQPAEALALLKPYLDEQIPEVSNKALDLAVNVYLGEYNWDAINQLVKHAEDNWELDDRQLRQLNYARAMSLQNLGEEVKAVPLWAELAKNPDVDPSFRGYAMYYLAKNAMRKQDLRRVFLYSQEALALLLQTDGDPDKIKDAVLMSINATERSGRYEQALRWAREYDKYIGPDHPEWAPTRLKLARIYRKAGAMDEWKALLQDIVDKKPDSLQADLARSELETYQLEQRAQEYAPSPQ